MIEAHGHSTSIVQEWRGERCDVLLALHAVKSRLSIERYRRAHPSRPVCVALTGTDVYGTESVRKAARRSMERAALLIVLQPLAVRELPENFRGRARLIYQSVSPADLGRGDRPEPRSDAPETFDVCVLAHLRAVKDPFRAARASRLLPKSSKIRVVQIGAALDAEMERRARREAASNPRYAWLESLPREVALAHLERAAVAINSSRREGGANAVGEAVAADVPVVASRIPGNVGLLGEDYPGYFEVGDTGGLAQLLWRVESDRPFREALRACCRRRKALFDPERERNAWGALLEELGSCKTASASG